MNDQTENRNLPFSQREGFKDLPPQMQIGEVSDDLRRHIWRLVDGYLSQFRDLGSYNEKYLDSEGISFMEQVFVKFYKRPHDEISYNWEECCSSFRNAILDELDGCRVIDLIELILNYRTPDDQFREAIDALFDEFSAPYYVDLAEPPFCIFLRTSPEETEATLQSMQVLDENGMTSACSHLRQAAEHLRQGKYANSITDSIHAVESVAKKIVPEANTLSAALNLLEKQGILSHPSMRQALDKLYGYTSDEPGLRHALLDKDTAAVGEAEALFMFNACAAFAGYLANKKRLLDADQAE